MGRGVLVLLVFLLLVIPLASAEYVEVLVSFEDSTPSSLGVMSKVSEKVDLDHIKTTRDGKVQLVRIKESELDALRNDPRVKGITPNGIVRTFLDNSRPLIGVDDLWALESDTNFTGKGQTVCVVDTGVDYTHEAFGSCSNVTENVAYDVILNESAHPYSNDVDENYTIVMDGYDEISVFFERVILARGSSQNDKITIYDGAGNEVISYVGNLSNFWTPAISGNNLTINLKSFNSETAWGFNATRAYNGTVNYTWNCPHIPNGFNFLTNTSEVKMTIDSHGTHVAGTISGNGTLKGVAPNTKLLSVTALDEAGAGSFADIYDGVEWCISKKEEYNVSVISMSLGGGSHSSYCDDYLSSFTSLFNDAVDKNISVVVATGNSYSTTNISFPACISSAIRVGSTNVGNNQISSFTSRGSAFNILMAPGSYINSSILNNEYDSYQGTSMATPHVSGVIALINEYNSYYNRIMNSSEIFDVLNSTGLEVDDTSGSGINYTRINAFDAIGSLDNTITFNVTKSVDNLTILDNITINWNASGPITSSWFNVSMPNSTMLFSSNISSGELFLNSSNFSLSGVYNITFYAENDFLNNTNNTSFELLKITPSIGLLLNENNSNISVAAENVSVNISSDTSPNNTYDLYINNEFNLTNSTINVSYLFDELGSHNITVKHNESEFYSEVQETLFVNLTGFPIVLEVNTSVSSLDFSENITISWNASGSTNTVWFNITDLNESSIFNSTNSVGEVFLDINNLTVAGVYNITLYAENSLENETLTSSFNVSKIVPNITLLINSSSSNLTLLENGSVNITAFENSSYSLDLLVNSVLNETSDYIEKIILFEALGSYNITARSNENDTHSFVQETLFLDVIEAIPNITSSTPSLNVSIYENQTVLLNHTSVDPLNRSLSYEWYLNDSLIVGENNTYLLFNGTNESIGNYNVTLFVVANETRNNSVSWNISVGYVPPSINGISPSNSDLVIVKQNKTLSFSHNSSNFYETNLTYKWFVNSSLVEDNSTSHNFNTSQDLGIYNVTLVVNNSFAVSNVSWNVSVINNRAPIFEGPSMSTRYIISLDNDMVLINDLNSRFSDPDGDTLTFDLEKVTSGSNIVSHSVGSNNIVVFATSVGQRDYRISATDGTATVYSNTFEIDVRPVTTSVGGAGGGAGAPMTVAATTTETESDDDEVVTTQSSTTQESSASNQETAAEFSQTIRSSNPQIVLTQREVSDFSVPLPTKAYKILEINSSDNVELEIEFDVEKSWVLENNLSGLDVALFKFGDGDWTELRTELIRENDEFYTYVAVTPGFSIFAIGERVAEEEASNFGRLLFNILSAVFAVVAILLTIVLIEKYAKKHAVKTVKEFEEGRKDLIDSIDNHKKELKKHIKENNISEAKKKYNELKEIYDHSINLDEEKRKELGKELLSYYDELIKK